MPTPIRTRRMTRPWNMLRGLCHSPPSGRQRDEDPRPAGQFLLLVYRDVMTGLPVGGRTLRFDGQGPAISSERPDVDGHHLAVLLERALPFGIADALDRDRVGVGVACDGMIRSVVHGLHFPMLGCALGGHDIDDNPHST